MPFNNRGFIIRRVRIRYQGDSLNTPILELKDICYDYPDGTVALSVINLSIERGLKYAVVGANGAGKSTMFLVINGVHKTRQGSIFYDGRKVSDNAKALTELRKKVGIVFQDPETQIFSASVEEEISFGLMNLGLPGNEVRSLVEEILDRLNIGHLKSKPVHLLSYGEKKWVSIADVIVMNPEIIIFDEPASCLDPKKSESLSEMMNVLNTAGKTIILSSHDMDFVYSWADVIIVMNEGRVIKTGEPAEIFMNDKLLESANLKKPLVMEIYEEMVKMNKKTGEMKVPVNKNELMDIVRRIYLN